MRRLKRLLLAAIGALAVALLALVLVASSAVVVWFGTGADPTDAFRAPELLNTSLDAERTWNDSLANGELSPLEGELLADAWADGFALLERRSNGEMVDLTRRFHPTLAMSLETPSIVETASIDIRRHDIDVQFVSTNRQVVALAVDVELQRSFDLETVHLIETYEAVLVYGLGGWTFVTLNRTDARYVSDPVGQESEPDG